MLFVVACESLVEFVAPVMAVRPLATLLDPSTDDPPLPPLFVAPFTAGKVLLLLLVVLLPVVLFPSPSPSSSSPSSAMVSFGLLGSSRRFFGGGCTNLAYSEGKCRAT